MKIRNLLCVAAAVGVCCGMGVARETDKRVEVELQNAGDSVVAIWYAVGGRVPRNGDMKPIAMRNGCFALDVPDSDSVYEVLFYPAVAAENHGRRPGRGWVAETKLCRFYLFPHERARVQGELSDSILRWSVNTPLYERKHAVERGEYTELRLKEFWIEREAEQLLAAGASKDTIREAFARSRRWQNAKRDWERAWFEQHPNEDLAALYLLRAGGDGSFDSLYMRLGVEVRNGRLKPLLDRRMAAYRQRVASEEARRRMMEAKEMQAPDFTLPDVTGNPFRLSSMFGGAKYVVLDFWGTWCGWCVKGLLQMKTCYAKYKERVEFVGVDCNEPEQAWRQGLERYQIPWLGVWAGENRTVQTAYGIEMYPTKIVIDPSGRILKRFEGESEEFYRYLDELLGGTR